MNKLAGIMSKLANVYENLTGRASELAGIYRGLADRQKMIVLGVVGAVSLLLIVGVLFVLLNAFSEDEVLVEAVPTPEPTPEPKVEPGVTSDKIVFGQSAAFTGPTQSLGWNMRAGIQAAFEEVNRQGGVNGRKLELIFRDDRYEPELTLTNTTALIEDDKVFALIGEVGTPTSRAAIPIAAAADVPFIAPFTGAYGFLRDGAYSNVINLRASYNDETEEMIERLTKDLDISRVAVLYQDDSFGRAGLDGVVAALARRDMEVVGTGIYARNTTAVKAALLDIRESNPQAIIVIGTPAPVATLVKWTRLIETGDEKVLVMTTSFAGSNALPNQLGSQGSGVFVTQVVPAPTHSSIPVVAEYRQALDSLPMDPNVARPEPDPVSLEGYLAGRLAIEALRRCGDDVTRQCFMDAIINRDPIDIGGFRLEYGDGDNQGSNAIFIAAIDEYGHYYSIESLQDAMQ